MSRYWLMCGGIMVAIGESARSIRLAVGSDTSARFEPASQSPHVHAYRANPSPLTLSRAGIRTRLQRPPTGEESEGAKAINLRTRQPATRHCVYPHVEHYVHPRDMDGYSLPIYRIFTSGVFRNMRKKRVMRSAMKTKNLVDADGVFVRMM